jgi:hypothetical protein
MWDRSKLPGLAVSTKRESERLKRLTVRRARDYIAALGRTAALARWRVRETLTVYAVNHPAIASAMTDVGCRRPRFRPELSETGFFDGISPVPGCLTGESEERETWTAESLRAASSNGEASAFSGRERSLEETWRSTFKGNTVGVRGAQALRITRVGPRQTCDLPESISSNLRV